MNDSPLNGSPHWIGSQIRLPTIEWLTFKLDGSLPNIGWLTIKWLTKLNGSPNWMTHKLDGSLLSGSLLNLMAHYQMLDGSLWNGWPNWVADTLDCPLPNIGWLTSRYWITFTIEWLIAHWVLGRTRGAYCIIGASLLPAKFSKCRPRCERSLRLPVEKKFTRIFFPW